MGLECGTRTSLVEHSEKKPQAAHFATWGFACEERHDAPQPPRERGAHATFGMLFEQNSRIDVPKEDALFALNASPCTTLPFMRMRVQEIVRSSEPESRPISLKLGFRPRGPYMEMATLLGGHFHIRRGEKLRKGKCFSPRVYRRGEVGYEKPSARRLVDANAHDTFALRLARGLLRELGSDAGKSSCCGW